MTRLFDGNLLIAMLLPNHQHHDRVHRWLVTVANDSFATCPVTEGTLLRLHMMHAADTSAPAAWAALASVRAHPRHAFWPENFSYTEIPHIRITGHRQITDAWLADLARRKDGKLATLDEALAVLYPEIVTLIPV